MRYLLSYTKHPRRNLPVITSRKRTEADFVFAFGKAFEKDLKDKKGISFKIAREFSFNGLGIADFICIKWENGSRGNSFCNKKKLLAFEMKIKDWRKALAQAYRYKYFANAVYVVLPPEEIKRAKLALSTFKMLKVGLWSFDKKFIQLKKIYSPKIGTSLSGPAHKKALELISGYLNLR